MAHGRNGTPTGVTRVMKLRSWGVTAGGSAGAVSGHRDLTAGDWWASLRLDFGGHPAGQEALRPAAAG
jgi:hypothetical protein